MRAPPKVLRPRQRAHGHRHDPLLDQLIANHRHRHAHRLDMFGIRPGDLLSRRLNIHHTTTRRF